MTELPNTVDTVLDDLHADKAKVLKGQRRSIESEIVERQLIAVDTTLAVEHEIIDVNSALLNLHPAHENAPDTTRPERRQLEHEKRSLTHEEREEQRETWNDVQQLKREEREIDREIVEAEQRRKRVNDLLSR